MSRDTDRLIEQLALEVVPVRPLASPMQRTVGWLAASMAVVAVLAVLLGWRGGMPADMAVPGGGLAPDGTTWVACRPGFFLPVRVLSRLFRRRFLEELQRLHEAGRLQFFGEHAGLADAAQFKAWLAPLRKVEWVVYAKRPFAGPQAVLAYLSRYTHRVAISNSRLVAMDDQGVSFRWKDYRTKGRTRYKTMTLAPQEFMRRFLLHVLPGGFHRIRHYGLLANGSRRADLARVREALQVEVKPPSVDAEATPSAMQQAPVFVCHHCGRALLVVQTILRGDVIRGPPAS